LPWPARDWRLRSHNQSEITEDELKRSLVLVALLASGAFAQQKNPVSSVVKDALAGREKNMVAAAEEMPADKFDFRPTPAQETFGHLVMHIAQANNFLCSKAGDVSAPKKDEVKDTDGKDKLVAALKASFEFCDSALAKADDSKLGDMVEAFGGKQQPRAWAWLGLMSNWADHYAGEAMYLRLNGLLPPTAQPKK
jgi:hypothetical protein